MQKNPCPAVTWAPGNIQSRHAPWEPHTNWDLEFHWHSVYDAVLWYFFLFIFTGNFNAFDVLIKPTPINEVLQNILSCSEALSVFIIIYLVQPYGIVKHLHHVSRYLDSGVPLYTYVPVCISDGWFLFFNCSYIYRFDGHSEPLQ